jgi:hypothetical protein
MGTELQYLPDNIEVIDRPLKWQRQGLQETSSGYGRKLTTTKMVKWNGRLYRVYSTIYGNIGTAYIISKGTVWLLPFSH